MNNIILLFKGFLIGIGKIIPGVSGSLIALNLGLYEKCIKAISSLFNDIKGNILFLSNIGIGIILAIIFGSNVINFLLNKYEFLTMISFIGLLIGSNMSLLKTKKGKKEYIYIFITFIIMFSLFFIKTNGNYQYKDNIQNNLYVILLGFLDASTMIIPAISGTVIFMLLGSYNFILEMFSNIFGNIKITILFFAGLFLGIFVVSKLIVKLLENKKNIIYSMINGFFLSSMLYMIIKTLNVKHTFCETIISVPLIIISFKIGKLSNK